jgi:hypothetical protein
VNPSHESKFELPGMLSASSPDPENIAQALDHLSHADRLIALHSLARDQLRTLYAVVEGYAPMTLDALVPRHVPPLQPVRHVGRNSLPLFSRFEKRFYRLAGEAAVGGANFQSTSSLTGPGYFMAAAVQTRGEIVIDYTKIPDRAPADWPHLTDNEHGIGRFVYGGMIDTLRRVSEYVSIGAAQRSGHEPSAYFVLCRLPDNANAA